jgi:hypothetical protein
MQILFAISILSFLVLLWAAVAITRRIRASHRLERSSTVSQPEFNQYFFAAAEGVNNPLSHTAAHPSPQDLSANGSWLANQSHTNSYDKATSPNHG